jgi:sulfate adenylyltransferase subunit 1
MTNATNSIATPAQSAGYWPQMTTQSALKFITCGSVDDGKSTLIGRLLVDSRSVLQDQLANVSKSGEADLALFTDGLSAEREQGITIDVAYRYFNTAQRKFIIGDAPGHEQYTRNMVTAASSADAAVVLVDATKLQWQNPALELLPQTRRHSLLVNLLRVPSIVFAVNKLDALEDAAKPETSGQAHSPLPTSAMHWSAFAKAAGITVTAIVPISALKGHNVVESAEGWCGYQGESLLEILKNCPTPSETKCPSPFRCNGWRSFQRPATPARVAAFSGAAWPPGGVQAGQQIKVLPSGQTATVAQVLRYTRQPGSVQAGHSAGVVLDREVDVSRGDWLLAVEPKAEPATDDFDTETNAGTSSRPAVSSRPPWPGWTMSRWWPAVCTGRCMDTAGSRPRSNALFTNLTSTPWRKKMPTTWSANAIGHVELTLQEPIVALPFALARAGFADSGGHCITQNSRCRSDQLTRINP